MMRLGLTGWPLGHSLSPRLQNAALRALGLDAEYSLYPLDPSQPQALVDLLNRLRSGEISGLNVTIPHKQAVIAHLDDLTASAREIGAVNTIYMQEGRLLGHNTDAPGFVADLRARFFPTAESWTVACAGRALVLGAGGSARAVVWALLQAGWQVTVAARRLEQAAILVESFKRPAGGPNPVCALLDPAAISESLARARLLVNTTSVGMSPKTDFSPWPLDLPFPAQAVLYDLVYNPRETLLVSQARAAGLRASTGLGMLVEQAALGFEIWTGRPAPRSTMFSAVEA